MGKAIGIDLGTTNSVVAFKDTVVRTIQTGANNEDLCRSCVAVDKDGNFIVGNSAYTSWKKYAPNIVVSAKRLMGAAFTDEQVQRMRADKQAYPYGIVKPSNGTEEAVAIVVRGKEYTPEKISAEILRSLKNDASNKLGEVTHAVITVPAYFTEKQKNATKRAAEMAGLHVQRLLAEPTAAAISYGVDQMAPGESKTVLVYDFGGGTFDLSILSIMDGQVIEAGAGGDRWLGGDDIDRKLIEFVCAEVEKRDNISLSELLANKTDREQASFTAGLKKDVEEAKKVLGRPNVTSATIMLSDYLETEDGDPFDDFTITRDKYESLIRPLISRTIQLIEELLSKTGTPIDAIDNIILVGGSSCIPLVKTMLSDKYGIAKVLSSEKPMLAVAEGAAILAQSLPCDDSPIVSDEKDETEPTGPVFATKHEYYIQLLGPDGNLKMEKIIDSQELLPLERSRQFHTSVSNQKIVEVKLFSDSENNSFSKLTSGFFTISEKLPKGSALNFTFNLDDDETMSADVMVVDSGKKHNIRLARGYADSSCLREISSATDEIFSDSSISNEKKFEFVEKIQQIIENIEANNYDADDESWGQLEEQVQMAKATAKMNEGDGENRLGEILATILLQNFAYCLNEFDKDILKNKLNQLHASKDSIQKAALMQDLETASNKYSLLLHVFMFRLVAQNSDNPMLSGQANCVYDEMQQALQQGNIAHVKSLLNANAHILESAQQDGAILDFGAGIS